MKIQKAIEKKVQDKLSPKHYEIENESHKHASDLGLESHFRLLVVSTHFEDKNRVQRQRSVFSLLREEIAQGVHALSLRLLTPEEYEKQGADSFQSPNCHNS